MADELPWIQWYPAKWLGDTGLRQCSSAARGLWIDILMFMHTCTPYGNFVIRGKPPTFRQIASLIGGITEAQVKARMGELEDAGVFDRNEDGVIISRRMIRDNARRSISKANGAKGGNPNLRSGLTQGVNQNTNQEPNQQVNCHVNGEDNALRKEKKREDKEERECGARAARDAPARKSRIPEDWLPDREMIDYAKERGITDIFESVEKFINYSTAHGITMANWASGWKLWCDREPEFRRNGK